MKKFLASIVIVLVLANQLAHAGRITFQNDMAHLVYIANTLPGDEAFLGQGVPQGPLPSGKTIVAGLYGGDSADALNLLTTVQFNFPGFGPGKITPDTLSLLELAGGIPHYFQVRVWESPFSSWETGGWNSFYSGKSEIFTVVPSATPAFHSIVNADAPAYSTWAAGTHDLSALYGEGALGAIPIGVPEPGAASLLMLSFVAGLVRRCLFHREA